MNLKQEKAKIYPWIKVTYSANEKVPDSTHEIKLGGEDSPVMQAWLGNLTIFYVVDTGDQFTIILKRHLSNRWTVEELHQIAINNLERDVEFRFSETSFGGYGLLAGGDHETGSLCLKNIWDWCANQIQDNLVVAVPAKDMVLMVPESDLKKIESLKSAVVELFKDGERLLTKQLYRYDKESSDWEKWGEVE